MIFKKLEYFSISGSDRHQRDIRAMLRLNRNAIDLEELRQWITRSGLNATWEKVVQVDR